MLHAPAIGPWRRPDVLSLAFDKKARLRLCVLDAPTLSDQPRPLDNFPARPPDGAELSLIAHGMFVAICMCVAVLRMK